MDGQVVGEPAAEEAIEAALRSPMRLSPHRSMEDSASAGGAVVAGRRSSVCGGGRLVGWWAVVGSDWADAPTFFQHRAPHRQERETVGKTMRRYDHVLALMCVAHLLRQQHAVHDWHVGMQVRG